MQCKTPYDIFCIYVLSNGTNNICKASAPSESPAPAFRPPWRPCSSGSWITSRHGAQAAMAAVHLGLAHLLGFRSHTFRSPAFGPVRRRTLIVCQVCPLAAMAAIGEPDAGPGPGPGLGKKSILHHQVRPIGFASPITKYGQSGFPRRVRLRSACIAWLDICGRGRLALTVRNHDGG